VRLHAGRYGVERGRIGALAPAPAPTWYYARHDGGLRAGSDVVSWSGAPDLRFPRRADCACADHPVISYLGCDPRASKRASTRRHSLSVTYVSEPPPDLPLQTVPTRSPAQGCIGVAEPTHHNRVPVRSRSIPGNVTRPSTRATRWHRPSLGSTAGSGLTKRRDRQPRCSPAARIV